MMDFENVDFLSDKEIIELGFEFKGNKLYDKDNNAVYQVLAGDADGLYIRFITE